MTQLIDPEQFNSVITTLRNFFKFNGYTEGHMQNRLSILSACEDPDTVSTFTWNGEVYPLPQTGQMWLEWELLTKRNLSGIFTVSTSYRHEHNIIEGRHDTIFPMFEFEGPGTFDDLKELEKELCFHLGFDKPGFIEITYTEASEKFNTRILDNKHEQLLCDSHGDVVLLKDFPYHTSPFWNMKRNGDIAKKVDVIICGMETIGSAERSTDPREMEKQFYTISEGKYANKLFSLFGKQRVERELYDFLDLDFFPRFGGGIGLTRLISAMRSKNLI